MSAAVAFTRATISALSVSVRVTGPLADLMYSVLPSTLSIVPATRWVCCCAHAVETANAAAKAATAIIRIVLISDLPKGAMRAEHTPVSPDGEAGAEGASGCVRLDLSASRRLPSSQSRCHPARRPWAAAMRLYARAGCGLVVGAYCAQYAGAPRPDDRRLGRPSANHRYQSVPRAGAERLAYRCC